MTIKYINYKKLNKTLTKVKQKEIVKKYKNNKQTIRSLSIEYNVPRYIISKLVKLNNIFYKHGYYNIKYTLDDTVLDKINTEEKAYFLGFFYADGYNYEKFNKIKVVIADQDRKILDNFKTLFKTDRPILRHQCKVKNAQLSNMLIISSKKLSSRLSELGAPQAKSYKIRFPKFLRKDLIRHFIRGYFDGDGGLSLVAINNVYLSLSIISNKYFIKQLSDKLYEYNFNHSRTIEKRNIRLSYITMKTGDTVPFLEWLYKDASIFLARKYDKFLKFKIERSKYELKCNNFC